MKLPLLFLLFATTAVAQVTNLTFEWDASTNATGYKFYDGTGTNKVLLGVTSNLTFTVTNWSTSTSRTVSVTATNVIGDSEESALVVPPAPAKPQNLKPVPLSILMPVPGLIELSQDLVDWSQRIRIGTGSNSTSVRLSWTQYPKEPMMFIRPKAIPPPTTPPLP